MEKRKFVKTFESYSTIETKKHENVNESLFGAMAIGAAFGLTVTATKVAFVLFGAIGLPVTCIISGVFQSQAKKNQKRFEGKTKKELKEEFKNDKELQKLKEDVLNDSKNIKEEVEEIKESFRRF